ncbi:hypothetical protein LWF15_27120 [Kineosporia rhizophila]|uniref:putative T7SS-secreted protein n=1 Tax=Kineosporia TaxID=49184 RepID=UPI001E3B80BD|nr:MULTISPECIES: hypothetical protein [Kineosporia]MCE0539178.1 hypothetical protein [Kineosporia rhizophila]GLY18058.1 hypothetical protein Kisp01_50720 [Kineosporia sp. NBRC 101677]
MSRPLDWAPLADSDPIPGDEAQLRASARRYRDFAAELEEQAAVLNRVAHAEGWDCGAQRAFSATAVEIAGQLTKVKGRYQTVGEALDTYAGELAHAQAEADAALQEAKQAEQQVKADAAARAAGTGPSTPAPAPGAPGADLAEALIGPRNRLNRARDQREDAGRRAADRVREAIDNDGLEDSWWDEVSNWAGRNWNSFMDWVHEHAEQIDGIADVLGKISSVLAVIGTVLACIPVVNALAPAFFAVGAGLTVISLGLHLMTAMSGDGSWVAVGLDVVGLATFGVGRALTGGVRVAQTALRGAAKNTALTSATASRFSSLSRGFANAQNAGRGLTTEARTVAQNAASRIAETRSTQAVNSAANQYGKASQWVSDKLTGTKVETFVNWATKAQSPIRQKVLGLDAEVVVDTAGHRALADLAGRTDEVNAALKTATTKANLGGIVDLVGLYGDVVDKSKVTDKIGLDDKLTQGFGRYVNQ